MDDDTKPAATDEPTSPEAKRAKRESEATPAMKLQKKRAIALWDVICKKLKEEAKAELEIKVKEDLEDWRVPPIFHALAMGVNESPAKIAATRVSGTKDGKVGHTDPPIPIPHALFIEGKNKIFPETHQLSAERVEVGTAVKCSHAQWVNGKIIISAKPIKGGTAVKEDIVYKLSMYENNDSAFFSSVKNNGVRQANKNLWDSGLIESWEFSPKHTRNVAALVNEKATMVGEDVEVTNLNEDSTFGMKPLESQALLTRSLSRGVLSDCFRSSGRASELAIVGSPGTGKSWTLLYALQQALLYEGACVVFLQQKKNMAYLCCRKDHRIYVWVASGGQSLADSILFASKEVLMLLDPAEVGAKYHEGNRMLIFAASNNAKHFASAILKDNAEALRYLSPWSKEELTVGLPWMAQDVNLELAFTRAKDVGMLPRYLLGDIAYKGRNRQLNIAVKAIAEDPKKVREALLCGGEDKLGNTIPGTIIAIYSGVQEPTDEVQDVRPREYEYDGPFGVVYTKRILGILSDRVMNDIVTRSREITLSFWGVSGSGMRSDMGHVVENLFWTNLSHSDPGRLTMKQWTLTSGSEAGTEGTFLLSSVPNHLDNQDFDKIIFVVDGNDTIARMKENCPLIDFAGPGRKVYQVTISGKHDFPPRIIKDLLLQLDLLKESSEGILKENPNEQASLEFYWVVPHGRESDWKKIVPKTVRDKVLKRCLAQKVTQYVLVMEAAEPFVPGVQN